MTFQRPFFSFSWPLDASFIVTSNECELLLAFGSALTLEKLAEAMGRELNQHTRGSIYNQRSLFQKQNWLRLGTNREFSARILGKNLNALQTLLPTTPIRISAVEGATETALLEGSIDIGIDCQRPLSPDIAYKLAITEPIIVICSPQFKKNHSRELKNSSFFARPHLLCDRLSTDIIFKKSKNQLNIFAAFNDIATTRAACESGIGWALLPKYAVQKEIDEKSLVEVPSIDAGESNYNW